MTLEEIRKALDALPKLPPRTQVVILSESMKSGPVYVPISDVRFDGGRVVIEDGGLRW